LELLVDTGIVRQVLMQDLLTEASALLAIFAASHWTARQKRKINGPMTR